MSEPLKLPNDPGWWWEASNDEPTRIYVDHGILKCGNGSHPREGFWVRVEKPLFGPEATVKVRKPGIVFRVMMKDPDTLNDAIVDAVKENLQASGLDREEQEAVYEIRRDKLYSACCRQWFDAGEYLEVEIDTGAMTCRVVPRN